MLKNSVSRAGKPRSLLSVDVARTVPHDDCIAFDAIYRQHVTDVYRYLLVRTGSEQDAQDLTAQTFLSALERLATYRGDGEFRAWLIGIARHKVADFFRQHALYSSLDDLPDLPTANPPPEEVVEQRLQVERVTAALRFLAPDRAEAVAMHVFGDLSYAEIGQIMQRSADAAKMLVHRGLRDLRHRLVARPSSESEESGS